MLASNVRFELLARGSDAAARSDGAQKVHRRDVRQQTLSVGTDKGTTLQSERNGSGGLARSLAGDAPGTVHARSLATTVAGGGAAGAASPDEDASSWWWWCEWWCFFFDAELDDFFFFFLCASDTAR